MARQDRKIRAKENSERTRCGTPGTVGLNCHCWHYNYTVSCMMQQPVLHKVPHTRLSQHGIFLPACYTTYMAHALCRHTSTTSQPGQNMSCNGARVDVRAYQRPWRVLQSLQTMVPYRLARPEGPSGQLVHCLAAALLLAATTAPHIQSRGRYLAVT